MPHKVVFLKEIQKAPLDEIIEEIYELDMVWKFNKIYLDETGLGAGVSDVLRKRLGEQNKTKPNVYTTNYTGQEKLIGITFSIKTKMDIFSNLKVLMEQGRLLFPNNKKLIFQLRDFRYERTESGNVKLHHSDGGRDDFCDSLALAARGLKEDGFILDW